MFEAENIIEIFNKYREVAILISLILNIIISLVGVLPSIFLTGANILFFGPIYGVVISLLGETIGGYITFKVYRLGLTPTKERVYGKYKLLDRLLDSKGINAGIVIFQGRVIPFIPSGFVTLAASISTVNDKIFIMATLLGKLPSILLEAMISYDVLNISENYIRLIFTLGALGIGAIIIKCKK